MAQYAIAFDLDNARMKQDGLTTSQITIAYRDAATALAHCGFTVHPQQSVYHTSVQDEPITSLMKLQSTLQSEAVAFCKYVKRVHVFRMEEWSDVTVLIANRKAAPPPAPEEQVTTLEQFFETPTAH